MSTNHVKFGDEQDVPVTTKTNKISMEEIEAQPTKKRVINMDDSDSESEDDAPEEEGAASTKADIEKKLQINEEAKKLEQQQLKEKRRKQNAVFKEQQSVKKQKISEEEEEKQNTAQKDVKDIDDLEPLEELPPELLQLDEDVKTNKNTHINFDDDDSNGYDNIDSDTEKTIRNKSLKNKRKNQLKDLRRKTSQNGPVSLRILSSSTQSKSMAPRKEVQITSTKDKWLRRRTLNRK